MRAGRIRKFRSAELNALARSKSFAVISFQDVGSIERPSAEMLS